MKIMKIYGPPGTGKTTTLISTLGKLLKRGYHPSQIAYLSHTRAAADEAKQRIALQFDSYNLQKDFKWFRTIHSACCALLGINANVIVSQADLKTFSRETGFIVKGSMNIESTLEAADGEMTHDIILNAKSLATHRMVPISDIISELPDDPALASTERFLSAYSDFKERLGKVDFDDMLILAQGKALPVKVILVDECQDLSDRQWGIIHSFAAGADFLYLAGDDDQAIYEFMGSSNGGFLGHSFDRETVLDHSYRCAKSIGDAADKIIRRVKSRHDKKVTWQDTNGTVERSVVGVEDLPWRDFAAGDKSIMVLFRHQRQCYGLSYTLQDMDIPHSINGSGITTSDLASLIKIYLKMRYHGGHSTAAQIVKIFNKCGDTAAANAIRNADPRNPSRKFKAEDCPSRVWQENDWPRAFSRWDAERKKLNVLRRMVNIHGLDIIGKPPMIDLSTYHGSKGRESDVGVLTTDCYRRTWDEQQRSPDRETRLCYVGITRARERVIILAPRTDMYMRALVEN